MPILVRDFESRSTLNLSGVGAWIYATHPSTSVLCCGYCVDDGPVKLWAPGDPVPEEFIAAAQDESWLVTAFNDGFERQIENHILGPRYGWPTVSIERHRCLQASALALALPASLTGVAAALGLAAQKDAAGRLNMMALSKPRKPKKTEPAGTYWHDGQERLERLYAYCRQDVEVERALHKVIGFLPESEQAVWRLDTVINNRGVHIDDKLAMGAIKIVEDAHAEIDAELQTITNGEVTGLHQTMKLVRWLGTHDCVVDDLQKKTLEKSLSRKNLRQDARRVIELRRDGAHAAAGKFEKMMAWRAEGDGRARGCFRYHGASTGRWSSLGLQLHNMKRPLTEDMTAAIDTVRTGSLDHLKQLHLPSLLSIVGDAARAALCASPGHRLIAADFSGIESRVLAWLSGQDSKLSQWARFDETENEADDPYRILGKRFGFCNDQARSKGKIADLAYGYQGGKGAYRALAPDDSASDEEIKRLQYAWRDAHPAIVRFWKNLNRCAVRAVQTPGVIFPVNSFISFRCTWPFLQMRLPSGRKLAYPFPELKTDNFGNQVVVYKDAKQGKWVDVNHGRGGYGGTYAENSTSAVARDLLAAALPRLEAAGYGIVAHVHDEAISEVPIGFGSAQEFKRLIVASPPWAVGLPIEAKAREGDRFCKVKTREADTVAIVVATPKRLANG